MYKTITYFSLKKKIINLIQVKIGKGTNLQKNLHDIFLRLAD